MKTRLLMMPILVGLLVACGAQGTPTASAPPLVVDDFAVIAEGRLMPAQHMQLAFESGGRVAEVLAAEGQSVQADDLLARLESSDSLQAQLAGAALEVLNAEQALKQLQDSAGLITAQAAYQVVRAQDAVTQADRDMRSVQNPVSQRLLDTVADAQLALETAQANLQLTNVSPEVQAFRQAVVATDQAFRVYQDLQARYEESNENLELRDASERAHAAYLAALDRQLALELTINTTEANQADTVEKAQSRYDDALANLANAERGPDTDRLRLAQANLDLAQATLADAQRAYDRLQSGPDPDLVALAEARIAAARANLAAVQTALDNAELRAPFSGTLARLTLKAGEFAAPGQPVATLADFSSWVVETDNLTEIEVVRVRDGQAAVLVFDALPGVALNGTVAAIGSVFEEKRGDVTYTARIVLAELDPLLRWGMTAQITFDR